MKTYKAVIIDDEYPAREIIKEYLSAMESIELAGEFSDGFEGLKGINNLHPDIIFLDIQMPKLTAFEMLDLLDEKPAIVFTTAFDHFAIKAFDENAIDYLLKPFSLNRFREAVEKALKRLKEGNAPEKKSLYGSTLPGGGPLRRIVVKESSEIIIIPVENIIFIEAEDDYVMIHLRDKKYLKQKTMNFFEKNLDPLHFLRVHRSYIVRLDQISKIEAYERSANIAILRDGRTIPISRSGFNRMKETLDI